MDNELIKNNLNFENIKRIDENGNEFWYAREFMISLEYTKWGNFKKVIDKAKESCKNSNIDISEQFADVGKLSKRANNADVDIGDIKLTRYACYLIAQNGDSRKKSIALAQTYFAIQTRKQELSELEYKKLPEDEKRMYTRQIVKDKNKYLFDTAKEAGVKNYGKFNNYGYQGLYNGENRGDIAKRKGITDKDDILDYMGSPELGANLFRITQTDEILKNKNVNNENQACVLHKKVGKAVRDTIKKLGGTMPEELPTPKQNIKQLEKEKKKLLKLEKKNK